MATQVHVAGLATIKVNTGALDTLEVLGYTRDGAELTFEGHWVDVPGDEKGGEAGPPIDVQYMGERARIRLELTKWDTAVADKVAPRLKGASPGIIPGAGSLMIQQAKTYRLLIYTPVGNSFNFLAAFPREAIEINKGTRFSRLLMQWEAHALWDAANNVWVLYNNATT